MKHIAERVESAVSDRRGRVLIVDDDEASRALLSAILSAQDHQVATAVHGGEGVSACYDWEPDAVVMDVCMPVMDGFEACRRIKSNAATRHIPVVLVTSLDAQRDRLMGIEAGADDFLTKPVNEEELVLRVGNAVSRSRLHARALQENRKLRDMEILRDNVIHLVVQDIRRPLATLATVLSEAQNEASRAGRARELKSLARGCAAADLIAEMIDSLQDLARLELDLWSPARTRVDLTREARAAADVVSPMLEGRRFRFAAPDADVHVTGDAALVRRICQGLIWYAVAHTTSDGEVRATVREEAGHAVVAVWDDGPPIPQHHHAAVFDKVAHGAARASGTRRGGSLSLAFCRLAALSMGGEMGIGGATEQGCTIEVRLPLQSADGPGGHTS